MRTLTLTLIALLGSAACSDDAAIDSDEEARRAYLGLDTSIEKSLALGFAGFNAASSANISPQMGTGTVAGTLVITGQVDQGSSDNKGMRLKVGMVDYTDGDIRVSEEGEDVELINVTYDTNADVTLQPSLQLSLRRYREPTGDFTGTLIGDYVMEGDLDGTVTLNLMFSGKLMPVGNDGATRVIGMTMVTGTAVSGDGTYDVTLTL